jgi:TolB-like protein/cytochrome c-type biogenesis protein CcmH/NrfG
VAEASHAVFLSYASQDAEAAQRICDALRAGGIEVFLDQSELRGGDAWDQKIRRQIKTCALFLPLISKHSHDRAEGYFRLEWKLAVDRSHLIAADKAFLVPVVIDDTRDDEERVPDRFREVQWTRLPAGETPPAFVERLRRLLLPEETHAPSVSRATEDPLSAAATGIRQSDRASRRPKPVLLAIIAVVVLAMPAAYFWISKHPKTSVAAFAPPAHSIAVLPFVNMSGDKEQEYFSEGLTEEILNSLAEVNNLQVAARTSAFSFKGTNTDIGTIAHKLNVASVLEGSVRRSGNTVRITAQLINALTGYHLWSHTYDRDLGDVLKLETDIAGAVASALKVSLLGEETAKIELGGTRNPVAFDAFLRARKLSLAAHSGKDQLTAIAAYAEAIGLDPNYALAYANRSIDFTEYASQATGPEVRESFDKALSDAQKAIALAPDLADGLMALAYYFETGALDFARATEEYERALALAPGNARVLRDSGSYAVLMGRTEAGIAALRRAVVLDPLSRSPHFQLGQALYFARQYPEAIAAFQRALALDPEYPAVYAYRGLVYYALGDFEHARAPCESKPDFWASQQCLAVTYEKLGRHADAESMLAKIKAALGDAAAYQYAENYAQWGNTPKALEWLDTAMRLRDPGLEGLKTDPLMDPLRKEPRFQAVMRELKFP